VSCGIQGGGLEGKGRGGLDRTCRDEPASRIIVSECLYPLDDTARPSRGELGVATAHTRDVLGHGGPAADPNDSVMRFYMPLDCAICCESLGLFEGLELGERESGERRTCAECWGGIGSDLASHLARREVCGSNTTPVLPEYRETRFGRVAGESVELSSTESALSLSLATSSFGLTAAVRDSFWSAVRAGEGMIARRMNVSQTSFNVVVFVAALLFPA
jgi:hypothetical protein